MVPVLSAYLFSNFVDVCSRCIHELKWHQILIFNAKPEGAIWLINRDNWMGYFDDRQLLSFFPARTSFLC